VQGGRGNEREEVKAEGRKRGSKKEQRSQEFPQRYKKIKHNKIKGGGELGKEERSKLNCRGGLGEKNPGHQRGRKHENARGPFKG